MAEAAKGVQVELRGLFLGFDSDKDTDKDGKPYERLVFVFEGSRVRWRDTLPVRHEDEAEAKAKYSGKENSVVTVPVQIIGKFANAYYRPVE